MSGTTKDTIPAREVTFDMAEKFANAVLGDELFDYELNDDELREIRQAIIALGLMAPERLRLGLLRAWLRDPDQHCPFLDEVALRRAIDFDWAVFDRLTRDERTEFYRRLALHPDPWGLERHILDDLPKRTGTINAVKPDDKIDKPVSLRRERWLRATNKQRQAVEAGVARARAAA